MPPPTPLPGAQAIGVFVVVIIVVAVAIYLPSIVNPPRERAAASSSDSFCPGSCPAAGKQPRAEAFGGPDPGVRAAPRVLPPAIALPIAGSQNWCGGNVVTPQRESRSASGPVREIALEFSDGW